MQEFHCPLPQAMRRSIAGVPLPTTPGGEAVRCKSCTTHCPETVRQGTAGIALPAAPGKSGSVLQESHYPQP